MAPALALATPVADQPSRARIDAACEAACGAIAPAWPLDRAIAVNPYWERTNRSVRQVAARMAVLADIRVFPDRALLRSAWDAGRISSADLAYAIRRVPAAQAAGLTEALCLERLRATPPLPRLPLLIDVLDDDPRRHTRLSWRQAISHQVSQTCASYFDELQADWQPRRERGLYAFWRDTLVHDHGIGALMGLPSLGRSLEALPATREEAEAWVIQRLGLPEAVWADYLEAVLLTVNGWASWCSYLRWEAKLAGGDDAQLRDLLAVRLAWGAILLDCKQGDAARQAFAVLRARWSEAASVLRQAEDALVVDEVWQVALEAGYQRELAGRLAAAPRAQARGSRSLDVQAAFCIDVRSEPLRRALESVDPAIGTIGFAGFFGLPIAYAPLATTARRPQLPGLLAPSADAEDRILPPGKTADAGAEAAARRSRRRSFGLTQLWHSTSRWPGTAFSFVESAGVGYLGGLFRWLAPGPQSRARDDLAGLPAKLRPVCRPVLGGMDESSKASLAARVLHAMGLDHDVAPLVLLVGHGSQSANNAHAAALDCGACCGQTGEVNARVLAQLLNDPAVRGRLAEQGIAIPAETAFVAALHNTTTDEIEGHDLDLLTPAARERWQRLQPAFAQACDQVRRERAQRLGLDPAAPSPALLAQLRRRASDGAQTRPEWGLAGNAAFIIGPRERSRGAVLDGRAFLHDYDHRHDADGSALELLMTAPMLVTHWINWQYHASTSDPLRMGSGNKLLHNVVGGRLGVFEGNGGDLRIGLSRQSLHDGERWMHEPLRLTVVIDAPREAIERVIARHAVVRQLLDNGWLHLWRYEGADLQRYAEGRWEALDVA